MKKQAHKHPYQMFSRKDTQRINSMYDKAEKKVPRNLYSQRDKDGILGHHMLQMAQRMAKSIGDWKKAARRGSAAEDQNFHDVAKIFFDRADELWVQAGSPTAKKATLRLLLKEEGLL